MLIYFKDIAFNFMKQKVNKTKAPINTMNRVYYKNCFLRVNNYKNVQLKNIK